MRLLHAPQTGNFYLGMGNDAAHLPVRPNIMLLRRDIQVADQNARFVVVLPIPPIRLFFDKAKLGGVQTNLIDDHPFRCMYWK